MLLADFTPGQMIHLVVIPFRLLTDIWVRAMCLVQTVANTVRLSLQCLAAGRF